MADFGFCGVGGIEGFRLEGGALDHGVAMQPRPLLPRTQPLLHKSILLTHILLPLTLLRLPLIPHTQNAAINAPLRVNVFLLFFYPHGTVIVT